MITVPDFMFYLATAMMIIVTVVLTVLLVYLIVAVRAVLRIAAYVEMQGRRAGRAFRNARRMFALVRNYFRF